MPSGVVFQAYCRTVTGDGPDLPQRRTLLAVLDRIRRALPLAELVGSHVDPARVTSLLRPAADADALLEWITVNGERVDAVVTAGDAQWRIVFGCSSGTVIDWLDVFERPARFDGVTGGRAVLINGPSGSGKTTLMRAIQQLATAPLVIFDEPEHIGTVQPAYLIWRDRAPVLHRGYLDAIAALARRQPCCRFRGWSSPDRVRRCVRRRSDTERRPHLRVRCAGRSRAPFRSMGRHRRRITGGPRRMDLRRGVRHDRHARPVAVGSTGPRRPLNRARRMIVRRRRARAGSRVDCGRR